MSCTPISERIDFDSRESLVNSYDGRGFKHMSRLLDGSGKIVTFRRYIADANGVANYYLTDYRGNVTEVVNASGVIVNPGGKIIRKSK